MHRLPDNGGAATVSGTRHSARPSAESRLRDAAPAPSGRRPGRGGAGNACGAGTNRGLAAAEADVTKCPRCFSFMRDDRFAWMMDPRIAGPRFRDADASAFYGAEIMSPQIYSVAPPPGHRGPLHSGGDGSRALGSQPVVEICPICHFVLP